MSDWPNPKFPSVPFEVGREYQTLGGETVTVVGTGHESVVDEHGCWRYNRPGDRGRTTSTEFDFTDQRNLIPEDEDGRQHPHATIEGIPGIARLLLPLPEVLIVEPTTSTYIFGKMPRWEVYTLDYEYSGHHAIYRPITPAYIDRKGRCA